jgi:hypothetical protein
LVRPLRRVVGFGLIALAALVVATRARASIIGSEPNNSPSKAFALPLGLLKLSDDLNGNVGRPDTLLGEFDPAFKILSLTDDNSNPTGNHKGSQLLGVPLRANGSAYFSVTGAGDNGFTGQHAQSGQYSILYQIRDAQHNLVKTLPVEFENVTPGMIDFIWLDPDPSKANWTGYTVDVTINNVVGPGTGDSLDFWTFSGLSPFQPFTAKITASTFPALTSLVNGSNAITKISDPNDPYATLTGTADASGKVKIGVSAVGDTLFKGEHAATGTYDLQVFPAAVPEPSSVVLAAMGAVACLALARRRRAAR